jgi:hypothetical protein
MNRRLLNRERDRGGVRPQKALARAPGLWRGCAILPDARHVVRGQIRRPANCYSLTELDLAVAKWAVAKVRIWKWPRGVPRESVFATSPTIERLRASILEVEAIADTGLWMLTRLLPPRRG